MTRRTVLRIPGALLLASVAAPAAAGTIFVGPACTPVQAVWSANFDLPMAGCAAGSGADTIVLEPGAVYTLTAVDNDIFGGTGPNAFAIVTTPIVVVGNGAVIERAAAAPEFRFFDVRGRFPLEGALRLEDLTLRGGRIQSNYPHTPFCAGGGAIRAEGDEDSFLELDGVTLTGNEVRADAGPAWVCFGGGALVAFDLPVRITSSRLLDNDSVANGGAIQTFTTNPLLLHDSVVDGNRAVTAGELESSGGGLAIGGGSLELRRSVISRNVGEAVGGIAINGEAPSFIANATISGNHATGVDPLANLVAVGGLGANSTDFVLVNTTIAGNRADGAIAVGGLYVQDPTILGNTIVAGNTVGGDGTLPSADCSEDAPGNILPVSHHNLYGLGTGCPQGGASDVLVAPAAVFTTVLGPLALTPPGTTETHALLAGSPAIDAADAGTCAAEPVNGVDQRGVARPVGPGCDIGAFEGAAPPVNDPPLAADDGYATDEDVDLVVDAAAGVLANDDDPDGDPLMAVLETAPASGALALNPDGSFAYAPNANFNGNDAFTYRARDAGGALSDVATVTIGVAAVNDPPAAAGDAYGVVSGTTLAVGAPGVLGNDADPDDAALFATLVDPPANGALVLDPDGSFSYVPAAGFVGLDGFSYVASDGVSSSAPATVSIDVTGAAMIPVAGTTTPIPGGIGSFTGFPAGPSTGAGHVAFLGNGSAGQSGLYAQASQGGLPPLRLADLATPIPGGAGTFTALRTPTLGFLPGDPCQEAAFAGDGANSQQGIYATSFGDASCTGSPIALADLTTEIPGGSGTFTALRDPSLVAIPGDPCREAAFAGDGDNGQQGIYATSFGDASCAGSPVALADIATEIPGGSGTFTALRTPTLQLTPGDPCREAAFVGDGANGQQGIYAASVGDGSCAGSPVALADLTTEIPGGSGTFTAVRDPVLSAQPGDPCHEAAFIGEGANGQQGIYATSFGDASCGGAPVRIADSSTAIPQGGGTFTAFQALSASGGHVAFLAAGAGGQQGIYLASTLTMIVDRSDTIAGKPLADLRLGREGLEGNQLTFGATFVDGSEGVFRVAVDFPGVNDPPLANPESYGLSEDGVLAVAAPGVLGNDSDADSGVLGALLVSVPAHGSVVLDADGSFSYTPAANFNGSDAFSYAAHDGTASSDPATVSLFVAPVNDAPVAADDSHTTGEGTPLTVAAPGVLGNDSDPDSPTLTAVLWSGPASGTLSLGSDGSFTYTPNAGFAGLDSFTYRASDGVATSAQATVGIVVAPASGSTWSPTGDLNVGRTGHSATLLPNGKVLVAGGYNLGGLLKSAELYDPQSGTWSATGKLLAARSGHTATLLPNGKVLVAGGLGLTGALKSTELYDSATGTWSPTGPLGYGRLGHSATLLLGGKVLVAGGLGAAGKRAELYDPSTGQWSTTGNLGAGRAGHSATLLLQGGEVLVAGGLGASGKPLAGAELYSPSSGAWSTTGSLSAASALHTATRLSDGRILLAGGVGADGSQARAELYDGSSGSWSPAGSLGVARSLHTATLLPDGRVLAAGGFGPLALDDVELYDPAAGQWSTTGSLDKARGSHTATLLPDGRVLAAGGGILGLKSAELYGAP